jgi:large subunit ribosomal protein L32
MAEPKKKSTSSSRKKRLFKNAYSGFKLTKCPKCGSMIKPHFVCPTCGFYHAKRMIDAGISEKKVKTKITKK